MACLVLIVIFTVSAGSLLLMQPSEVHSAQYVDPRIDRSSYDQWCQAQGGHPVWRYGNRGCDRSSARSRLSAPSFNIPGPSPFAPLQRNIELLIRCGVFNQCPGTAAAAEQAARAQAEYEREYAAQQELIRRREAQRAAEFEAARQRMLREMRGMGEELRLRALALDELDTIAARGLFGTTEIRPRDLRPASPGLQARLIQRPRQMTLEERTQCARSLLVLVDDSARRGRYEEAALYSNEAGNLLTGSPSTVSCPSGSVDAPPTLTPTLEGRPVGESAEAAEQERRQVLAASLLLRRAMQQTADYQVVQQSFEAAKSDLEEARRRRQETEQRLAEAEQQRRQNAAQQPDPGADAALAAARRALDEANRAYEESARLVDERQASLNDLSQHLDKTRHMLDDVTNNPAKTEDILAELK